MPLLFLAIAVACWVGILKLLAKRNGGQLMQEEFWSAKFCRAARAIGKCATSSTGISGLKNEISEFVGFTGETMRPKRSN